MTRTSRISYILRSSPLARSFIWLGLSVIFALFCVVLKLNVKRSPTITAISPSAGKPGDIITITGSDFGTTRNASIIEFSNVPITTKSIVSWTNTQITLYVPEDAESGFIKIGTKKAVSPSAFFTNITDTPQKAPAPPAVKSEPIQEETYAAE